MSFSPQQLQTLKAFAQAVPEAAGYIAAGNDSALTGWFNTETAFVVWKKAVMTADVGKTVNYDAVAAMTTGNISRINNFYVMNPISFDASRLDIRNFWTNTFSGALDGQGQATRDALEALWRRVTNRAEQALSTGTGTTNAPATLSFEGTISTDDAAAIRVA
jgi:hypothetical protein